VDFWLLEIKKYSLDEQTFKNGGLFTWIKSQNGVSECQMNATQDAKIVNTTWNA
jgi:hypothetical protein